MLISHVLILIFIQKLNEDNIIIIVIVMSVFEVFQHNLNLTINDMLPSLSIQRTKTGTRWGQIWGYNPDWNLSPRASHARTTGIDLELYYVCVCGARDVTPFLDHAREGLYYTTILSALSLKLHHDLQRIYYFYSLPPVYLLCLYLYENPRKDPLISVLATLLLSWRDTLIKATYEERHLTARSDQ